MKKSFKSLGAKVLNQIQNKYQKNSRPIKALGLIIVAFIGIKAYSQFAVYDASADMNAKQELLKIIEQLKQAKEQTQKQKDIKKVLEQNQEFITKVSSAVKNSQNMQNVIINQESVYNLAYHVSGNSELQNPRAQLYITKSANQILSQLESNISGTNDLVSGKMVMNDAERLNLIKEQQKEADQLAENLIVRGIIAKTYERNLKIYNARPVTEIND